MSQAKAATEAAGAMPAAAMAVGAMAAVGWG